MSAGFERETRVQWHFTPAARRKCAPFGHASGTGRDGRNLTVARRGAIRVCNYFNSTGHDRWIRLL